MTSSEQRSGWERINESSRPDYYVHTLATITGWEFVQEYKQLSYALLQLGPGDWVLDMGCGMGDDVAQLAERVGYTGRAIGIDLSQEMIAQARQRHQHLPQSEFQVADATALPFPDASFQACRADRVFQHLARREQALAELVRVLRPGGRLVCIDPDWETLVFDLPDRPLTRKVCAAISDRVKNGWAAHQTARMAADAGLTELAVRPITSILNDLALARAVLEMDVALQELGDRGVLSADELRRWWALLEEVNAAGRFFGAMTGFITFARKPEIA